MNYIRTISRETSAASEQGLYNLHFGICGHAGNVMAELMNLQSNKCIVLNNDKNGLFHPTSF